MRRLLKFVLVEIRFVDNYLLAYNTSLVFKLKNFFIIKENDPSYLLSGQRFEDNTDEMDDEDTEKNYILIFDESTKVQFNLI